MQWAKYEFDISQIDYKYKFTSLPICNYKFPRGELTIVTTKNNQKDSIDRLELRIGFNSKESRDSLCRELATLLKKCSLDDFEPIENAPSEFHVGIFKKNTIVQLFSRNSRRILLCYHNSLLFSVIFFPRRCWYIAQPSGIAYQQPASAPRLGSRLNCYEILVLFILYSNIKIIPVYFKILLCHVW